MNKLIYAIGIAVASTFAANTTTIDTEKETPSTQIIQQIDEFQETNKTDSLSLIL